MMIRLTALALLVACGGDAASRGGRATAPLEPATRDSAGVTIHEHPVGALERAPLITMDSLPLGRISGTEVENDVSRMYSMVFLTDGRVAGFDVAQNAIRLFGAEGTELARHGRRGEGPGEFGGSMVNLTWVSGDSLVVTDVSNGRLAVVSPDSGVVRLQPTQFRNEAELHFLAGRLGDGSWLLGTGAMMLAQSVGKEQPPRRPPLVVGVVREGAPADRFDTLMVVPGMERARYRSRFGTREELVDGLPAFGARTLVTEWNDLAAIITNDGWRIARHGDDGRLVSIVRVNGPLQPVSDSVVEAWKRSLLDAARDRGVQNPDRATEVLANTQFYVDNTARADSIPPFMSAHRTPGRLLWLMDYSVSSTDSVRFTAVDFDGRIIGRLTLPPATRALAFADDRVAIRTEDDDGIATITIRKLNMP
jgi:hypothetical protein